MIVRAERAGVELQVNTEATPARLQSLAPDAVILATGARPFLPPVPDLDALGYVTAQDMLAGKAPMGRRVLVVGGGMVGCEAAGFLAERGHEVAILEKKEEIAADVTPENRRYLLEQFRTNQVVLMPGAEVKRFYADGVDYVRADSTSGSLRGYDNVVLAMGARPDAALREAAEAAAAQVFVIGEAARAPGNAVQSVGDALRAALEL